MHYYKIYYILYIFLFFKYRQKTLKRNTNIYVCLKNQIKNCSFSKFLLYLIKNPHKCLLPAHTAYSYLLLFTTLFVLANGTSFNKKTISKHDIYSLSIYQVSKFFSLYSQKVK